MQCTVLNDSAIRRLHPASLIILERTGIHVPHKDVLGGPLLPVRSWTMPRNVYISRPASLNKS